MGLPADLLSERVKLNDQQDERPYIVLTYPYVIDRESMDDYYSIYTRTDLSPNSFGGGDGPDPNRLTSALVSTSFYVAQLYNSIKMSVPEDRVIVLPSVIRRDADGRYYCYAEGGDIPSILHADFFTWSLAVKSNTWSTTYGPRFLPIMEIRTGARALPESMGIVSTLEKMPIRERDLAEQPPCVLARIATPNSEKEVKLPSQGSGFGALGGYRRLPLRYIEVGDAEWGRYLRAKDKAREPVAESQLVAFANIATTYLNILDRDRAIGDAELRYALLYDAKIAARAPAERERRLALIRRFYQAEGRFLVARTKALMASLTDGESGKALQMRIQMERDGYDAMMAAAGRGAFAAGAASLAGGLAGGSVLTPAAFSLMIQGQQSTQALADVYAKEFEHLSAEQSGVLVQVFGREEQVAASTISSLRARFQELFRAAFPENSAFGAPGGAAQSPRRLGMN